MNAGSRDWSCDLSRPLLFGIHTSQLDRGMVIAPELRRISTVLFQTRRLASRKAALKLRCLLSAIIGSYLRRPGAPALEGVNHA